MVRFDEALKIILETIPEPDCSIIPVNKSHGRVLAEDLIIKRDFPDIRLSAIDGYAFRIDNVTKYKSMCCVGAGHIPDFSLQPGQCSAVMTGAPVPKGTDCVVKVEHCEEKSGFVKSNIPLKPGNLINENASEAIAGEPLVQVGSVLNKSIYPTLFYAGIPEVKVFNPPKIGMLITGDEICDIEAEPKKGQVFNTNLFILQSFLNAINLEITTQIHVKDNEIATRKGLEDLENTCDIIVTSGGVSMGRYDYVKRIFSNHGYTTLIKGTAIKPGSPLMVVEAKGKLYFGMPGYPAAFLTNCIIYLLPALKKACGRSEYNHQLLTAILATPLQSRKGRLYLNRVKISLNDDFWVASTPGSQKTSHFLNFSNVNGLALLPEDVENLNSGSKVKCIHFDLMLC